MSDALGDIQKCLMCGKNMIQWPTGLVQLSYPGRLQWEWRCGCGHDEVGGFITEQTAEYKFRAEWAKRQ